MTIVETALERAKELTDGGVLQPVAPTLLTPVARTAPTPFPTQPRVPQTRLQVRPVHVDLDVCRENRLLLSSTVREDAGVVAAYRMLRTRILHRIRQKKWTTIGITSTAPSEGKTLTALNLSVSIAREKNSEVVLLDLDMRNPSVCRSLEIDPPTELVDFFAKPTMTPDDLFFSVGVDNLVIAGQNTPTDQASELLASNRFETLMSHIKDCTVNPLVLIDLPPVLSTDDVLVLAPRLDALLLVVAEGKTDRGSLEKATELLSEFQLAGMVLNQSRDITEHYSYGYGYDAYGPQSR